MDSIFCTQLLFAEWFSYLSSLLYYLRISAPFDLIVNSKLFLFVVGYPAQCQERCTHAQIKEFLLNDTKGLKHTHNLSFHWIHIKLQKILECFLCCGSLCLSLSIALLSWILFSFHFRSVILARTEKRFFSLSVDKWNTKSNVVEELLLVDNWTYA